MAKYGKSTPESDAEEPEGATGGLDNTETEDADDEAEVTSNGIGVSVIPKSYRLISTPISIFVESLINNLCMIYEKDAKKAHQLYNAICEKLYQMKLIGESYNMEEFEALRLFYQNKLHNLMLQQSSTASKNVTLQPVCTSVQEWNCSHYENEFHEIEMIARGGFGQVFRVRNRLDGVQYAVKKIPIRSDGIESVRNYLSEVKTFSCLNHANIVQYKAAWLELGTSTTPSSIVTDYTDDSSSFVDTKQQQVNEEYIFHQDEGEAEITAVPNTDKDSDFEISFEHSATNIKSHTSHTSHSKRSGRVKRNSTSEGGMAICKLDHKEIRAIQMQQRAQIKWATLYIQMSLCQSTLKQWLEQRNETKLAVEDNGMALVPIRVRNETTMEVLRQLLQGLEYIHSKGIVHHDIKPSNIFIQMENNQLLVQLGDFGLACPLQSVRHSLAFGTKSYAAPEQLAGKCDPKSDMYSLGIVLFELVENFHTDMERVEQINELRKGKLPQRVHVQNPDLAKIIVQLMARAPEDRPKASDLLNSIIDSTTAKYVQELEAKLAERDKEIERLQDLLKSAGLQSI